jgi:hypothetical protein
MAFLSDHICSRVYRLRRINDFKAMRPFFLKSLRVRLLLLVFVAVPAWGVIAYTASEQKRIAMAEIQRNVLRSVQSCGVLHRCF